MLGRIRTSTIADMTPGLRVESFCSSKTQNPALEFEIVRMYRPDLCITHLLYQHKSCRIVSRIGSSKSPCQAGRNGILLTIRLEPKSLET